MQGRGPLRGQGFLQGHSPCTHRCEEGLRPSRSKSSDLAPRSSPSGGCAPTTPMGRALRPSTPGDFPVAEKVTKGAPRAAPFGIPRCEVSALFALAYASRRATFCLQLRPICHFEIGGRIGLFFSRG